MTKHDKNTITFKQRHKHRPDNTYLNSRWLPQNTDLSKHTNIYNSVLFTEDELKFGLIVDESDFQHLLQASAERAT